MEFSYTTLFSALGGILPPLIWLWFWRKEDAHPEPRFRITAAFLAGMIAVLLVIPIERFFYRFTGFGITSLTLILWAGTEELLKFGAAYFSAIKYKDNDEPLDPVIYTLSAALGFSALENAFFLSKLIDSGSVVQSIISGNMRFLGATILHSVASATIGTFLGFSFYKGREAKKFYLFTGLVLAIVLHTLFNSLIIKSGQNTFLVFGAVWASAIALIVIFEKVKRIKKIYLD